MIKKSTGDAASRLTYGDPKLEFLVSKDDVLITRTDPKGVIVYANDAFLESAQFTLGEVLGKAHNIIRHPDMPRAVFADIWGTLKTGKSWSGIVKNQRKNGGFYWVRAFVTPVASGGKVTGYMSVRVRATKEEVAAAIAVYRQLDAGTLMSPDSARQAAAASAYILQQGMAVRRFAPLRLKHWLMTRPVGARLGACCAMLSGAVGVALLAPVLGLPAWLAIAAGITAAAMPWVGFAYLNVRILQPLGTLNRTIGLVISGTPLAQFTHHGDQAILSLASGMNQMTMRTAGVLRDVQDRLAVLTATGNDMQATSEGLSAGAEQQAASIASVSQSIAGIAGGVRQTTRQSDEVTDLARQALALVDSGTAASHDVSNAFNGIDAATRQVTTLMVAVRAIAMQTNILAINAHVEAAHAGQAGAGFAVIAMEVRSLSERVTHIVDQVDSVNASVNSELVNAGACLQRMHGAIADIQTACSQVGGLATEVAATTHAQSAAISEVSDAMGELDTATQQNAQAAENSARAAHDLLTHAMRLGAAIA
ncbi:methyl-accepting chemotaxis protein [Massilia sp. DWR3-1-1]|uniref:methyl-accepting chemotaxis protein n=1 Tax=Massilia sp. DWR3-1-1 TaxID=2804559 RepID=UPI003CE68E22